MAIHPRLADRTCYHRYEIEPGLTTPGTFIDVDPRACLDELGVPPDLSGLKALDIGAWDGAFTFELLRRGARVTALDIQHPDVTVFNAVRDLLQADVRYVQASIYDLDVSGQDAFDLVLFAGVYYHLKHPMLALQRIRQSLADSGSLFIEGASCSVHLAQELAREIPGATPDLLAVLVDRLPISLFDMEKKVYRHWSNWWFPTTQCLQAMLTDCGFRDVRLALRRNAFSGHTHLRLMGQARADARKSCPGLQRYEHEVYDADYASLRMLGQGK
jgi:tRNA (mo5U34)-methyltransferase